MNRTVGELLMYKCDSTVNAVFKKIQVCDEKFRWTTLVSRKCTCSEYPITLGDRSILVRNHDAPQSYSFMCSDYANSTVRMKQKCTNRVRWEKTFESKCECTDDLPLTESANVFDLWSESESREIDTVVYQKCMRSPESPLYRIILCDETYRWKIVGQNACECPTNPPEPPTVESRVYEAWSSGNERSFSIGSTVTYHCTFNPRSAAFLSFRCDFQTVWECTYEAMENCIPKYLMVPPKTLEDANIWCLHHGGRLFRFRYISDQDFFPGLFSLYPDQFDCSLEVYHVGLSELVRYQWMDRGGDYISPPILKPMWEEGYPKDSQNECVVLTENGKLQNVPCHYNACFICEDEYCFQKMTPCYNLITKRGQFEDYTPSCTVFSQEPALINSQTTFDNVIKEMMNWGQPMTFCKEAYVAIAGGDRVWQYSDGTLATVYFWEEGEPKNFNDTNVVTHASSGFMRWRAAPKNVLACGVCEYTAEAV